MQDRSLCRDAAEGRPAAWGGMEGGRSIHIGTSGWHYQHWRGNFYPLELTARDWLDFYHRQFKTVEINNSFYQLPSETTLRTWYASVPGGFTFAVKASRFITHMKKLTDPKSSSALFFERAALLGEKLGPILFQLPPRWGPNLERLDAFLTAMPGGHQYSFEFRDPGWLIQPVFEILAKHNAALCVYNFNRLTSPAALTANFVYLRLHGPGGPYQGKYSQEEIAYWAGEIANWTGQGKEVYCYFDNDTAGYAPQNARELVQALNRGDNQ